MYPVSPLLPALLRRLPQWSVAALKAIGRSLWRWYWNLGMIGMFIATAVAGVVAWTTVGYLPANAGQRRELRQIIESVLLLGLLLSLIIGMLRGDRHSR